MGDICHPLFFSFCGWTFRRTAPVFHLWNGISSCSWWGQIGGLVFDLKPSCLLFLGNFINHFWQGRSPLTAILFGLRVVLWRCPWQFLSLSNVPHGLSSLTFSTWGNFYPFLRPKAKKCCRLMGDLSQIIFLLHFTEACSYKGMADGLNTSQDHRRR